MTLSRLVPLYVALVLTLATLGAVNQARFQRQAQLIERKGELYGTIGELRSQAAAVQGPLAVGAWAREHGMVPAPEVSQVRHVAPLPAPRPQKSTGGFEMRTIWR